MAGVTLVLWYPPSAAAAAAAAAFADAGKSLGGLAASHAELHEASPQQTVQPQQRNGAGGSADGGDAAEGVAASDAFEQPGDSVMQAGDSFMSAASQLRWSGATSFATAAGSNAWTANASQQQSEALHLAVAAAGGGGADRRRNGSAAGAVSSEASAGDGDFGRLELECTDLVVDASGGGGVTAAAQLYALSALEYLPTDDAG